MDMQHCVWRSLRHYLFFFSFLECIRDHYLILHYVCVCMCVRRTRGTVVSSFFRAFFLFFTFFFRKRSGLLRRISAEVWMWPYWFNYIAIICVDCGIFIKIYIYVSLVVCVCVVFIYLYTYVSQTRYRTRDIVIRKDFTCHRHETSFLFALK